MRNTQLINESFAHQFDATHRERLKTLRGSGERGAGR
jgi:hypothetical protein